MKVLLHRGALSSSTVEEDRALWPLAGSRCNYPPMKAVVLLRGLAQLPLRPVHRGPADSCVFPQNLREAYRLQRLCECSSFLLRSGARSSQEVKDGTRTMRSCSVNVRLEPEGSGEVLLWSSWRNTCSHAL